MMDSSDQDSPLARTEESYITQDHLAGVTLAGKVLASITAAPLSTLLSTRRLPGGSRRQEQDPGLWSGLSKVLQPPSRAGLPCPPAPAPHVSPSEAHSSLKCFKVTTQTRVTR
ncbi:Complement C2 [Manis pentadactyla]|nr:Complement C2 [Manis pentadactyla]